MGCQRLGSGLERSSDVCGFLSPKSIERIRSSGYRWLRGNGLGHPIGRGSTRQRGGEGSDRGRSGRHRIEITRRIARGVLRGIEGLRREARGGRSVVHGGLRCEGLLASWLRVGSRSRSRRTARWIVGSGSIHGGGGGPN